MKLGHTDLGQMCHTQTYYERNMFIFQLSAEIQGKDPGTGKTIVYIHTL